MVALSARTVYAATLEDLFSDLHRLFPNAIFEVYLDSNDVFTQGNLAELCQRFPGLFIPKEPTDCEIRGG